MTDHEKGKAVTLSADLYDRIEERARATGFGSVEEYVTSVMEEALNQQAQPALSKEDEEEVKKRLKALGYLE